MSNTFTPNLYRHSGQFSMVGLMLATIGGLAGGIALAWLYVFLQDWIPLVYLNLLLCLGFGGAVGLLTGIILKVFKCRNTVLSVGLGLLVAAVALLAAWDFWVYRLIEEETPGEVSLLSIALNPSGVFRFVSKINEIGTFSLGRSSKTPVSGIALWVCWFAEAGLFFTLAFMASKMVSDSPFCEACSNWCEKRKPKLPGVRLTNVNSARSDADQIASGDFSLIRQRGARPESDGQWLDLEIHQCLRCKQTATLTVQLGTVVVKDGKAQNQMKMLVKYALLSPEQVEELQAAFTQAAVPPAPTLAAAGAPLPPLPTTPNSPNA